MSRPRQFLGFDTGTVAGQDVGMRGPWVKGPQHLSGLPLQLPANLKLLQEYDFQDPSG